MKIGIASDHGGYNLKNKLIKYLNKKNIEVIDYGTNSLDSVDYPDYAFKVSQEVLNKQIDLGCLICTTGLGMCIAANKVKGIRCAKVDNIVEARMTREHNDSNIISISGTIGLLKAKKLLLKFIETEFSNEERHIKRIDKIKEYENEH